MVVDDPRRSISAGGLAAGRPQEDPFDHKLHWELILGSNFNIENKTASPSSEESSVSQASFIVTVQTGLTNRINMMHAQ
jgi:hypothetical protein